VSFVLQLDNRSPFRALTFDAPDLRGVDSLIVVVKASFELGPPLSVAATQRAIVLADQYWGDPATSSLRYPSELHLPKPGTDVIVNGEACAPRGRAVTQLDVGVRVGARCKYARVFGDRLWTPGYRVVEPCRPQPFVRMPIVYERAFGGSEPEGEVVGDNPVGMGMLGSRAAHELVGQPVPNIDDLAAPLRELGQRPTPAGFGALAPSWSPRARFAGTYDERWLAQRAPFLPEDFDPRFFNVAAPGMSFAAPLEGGEPIVLAGLDPDRHWEFCLPRCELELRVQLAGEPRLLRPTLDTVLLEPSESHMSLTWRAALALGDDLLRVERVRVSLIRLEGAGDPSPYVDQERGS
jgi:hypothetical protein